MSQDIEVTSNLHLVRGVFFLRPGGCPVPDGSVAVERVGRQIGRLPPPLITELDQALRIHFSL
jgi:hypothetical protein